MSGTPFPWGHGPHVHSDQSWSEALEVSGVPVTSPARGGPDSEHMCICTTPERERGRYFRGCPAHQRPATSGVCHHTADEGCTGHGDF